MKNLYMKMANVMKEIRTVKQNGWNEYNKYNYATEKDLLDEVKPLLLDNGLIVVPNVLEQQKTGDIATVKIEFTLIDIDSGEELKTVFFGEGQDKGDKATYKAYTGATKYYLMKTFLIPTGDDPEADKGQTEVPENGKFDELRRTKKEAAPKEKIIELKRKWKVFKPLNEFGGHYGKPIDAVTETEAQALIQKLDQKLSETDMTPKQRAAIFAKGKDRGLTSQETKQVAYNYANVESMKEMNALQAYDVYALLEGMQDKELHDYIQPTTDDAPATFKAALVADMAKGIHNMQAMG